MSKFVVCLRAMAQVFFSLVMAALLPGCAIVPGLQIDIDNPPAESRSVRVTENNGSKLVEVVSDNGIRQGYRLVNLTGETLLAEKSAALQKSRQQPVPVTANAASAALSDYKVGVGDVLQIIIWDHPELTSPTGDFRDPVLSGRLVSAGGTIFYPYIGEIQVAGLTGPQIREQLVRGLSRVIAKPQIDVRVIAYRSQRVQVAGEVASPGLVALDDTQKGVLEAINERGGLSSSASRRMLRLIRDGKTYMIDFATLLAGENAQANPLLLPGDVVQVPHRDAEQVFVLGEVTDQAAISLEQADISLTQVLAKSGGLDQLRSDDSGVLIFRRAENPGDYPTVFAVDISEPLGLLVAGEFTMEPRDVVYVKTTGFAKYNSIIAQLLPTVSAVFQIDSLVRRY